MTRRRTRVVALGYQGFGNLGDEAILAGIEELLGDQPVDVTILVCGPAPIVAFPAARRIISRRLIPTPRAMVALARADALMMTGGGLLHDHYPLVLPRYLAWTIAARFLRCRVVWLGVGVGPFRRRRSRRLAAWILRLSHRVFVRDEASATLCEAIGRHVDGVIPDPAMFLSIAEPTPNPVDPLAELAVIVRPPISPGDGADRLHEALAEVLAVAQASGRPVSVLTFAGERDQAFAEALVRGLGTRGAGLPSLEALPPDPRAALRRLARAGLVVSVRLHGMILAAVAGRPFAAVAYDQKISAVAAELDAAEQVVALGDVTAAALDAAIERALEPSRQGRVAARLAALRERRSEIQADITLALRPES